MTVAATAPTGTGRGGAPGAGWRWHWSSSPRSPRSSGLAHRTPPRRPDGSDRHVADGAHALVTLLRDRGVDVVVAGTADDVERARPPRHTAAGRAETYYLVDDDLLRRLAELPGDRLLVEPRRAHREALAPAGPQRAEPSSRRRAGLRSARSATGRRRCSSAPPTPTRPRRRQTVTSCYGGALVRYSRRRPHRHRGRQRGLHDQLGAAAARATPRWR